VPRRGCIDVLLISCPHCGARDQTEFAYGGDASVVRPAADAPLEAWFAYVYLRDNPAGPHRELWYHGSGCRNWLVVTRNTVTHVITGARFAKEPT
jgi:heterotetrameric sarcosine oxidase delta subunit